MTRSHHKPVGENTDVISSRGSAVLRRWFPAARKEQETGFLLWNSTEPNSVLGYVHKMSHTFVTGQFSNLRKEMSLPR